MRRKGSEGRRKKGKETGEKKGGHTRNKIFHSKPIERR
jgi:hypothetical protein